MANPDRSTLSPDERALARQLGAQRASPHRTDAAFAARVAAEVARRHQRLSRAATAWLSTAACASALLLSAQPATAPAAPVQERSAQELFALSAAAIDADAWLPPLEDAELVALAEEPFALDAEDDARDLEEDAALSALTNDVTDTLSFSPSDPWVIIDVDDDRLVALSNALSKALSTRSF